MDGNQTILLRKLICAEITALEQDIEGLIERSGPVAPDNAIGRISRMDAMLDQGVQQQGLGQARIRMKQLKQALYRLENSQFGICESCDEEIAFERMKLMPESRYCVSCIDAAERQ